MFSQECPPVDTLSTEALQNLWSIPSENIWNNIEIMTWNVKQFPLSNNTIPYINEIILDILPDIIAFQEINNASSFNSLANSMPAYEFISSGIEWLPVNKILLDEEKTKSVITFLESIINFSHCGLFSND